MIRHTIHKKSYSKVQYVAAKAHEKIVIQIRSCKACRWSGMLILRFGVTADLHFLTGNFKWKHFCSRYPTFLRGRLVLLGLVLLLFIV